MNSWKQYFLLLLVLTILCGCSSSTTKTAARHQVNFVMGSTGNKLEVLDWGGSGEPLLFLSGLGNSAHVFDDFAPAFNDRYHVYGITRRGFGASDHAVAGFSTSILTADILAVADSLRLKKFILVGHSIAGDEITKFAGSYPGRVAKAVYLEAAYDHTDFINFWSQMPEVPKPNRTDSSSLPHMNDYLNQILGLRFPEEEVKQITIADTYGKYLKDATPDSINMAVIEQSEHPNYSSVQCPALAIYAGVESMDDIVTFYAKLDALNKKKAVDYLVFYKKVIETEKHRFAKEIAHGTTKVIKGAKHYLFISNQAETEKMIREFLE